MLKGKPFEDALPVLELLGLVKINAAGDTFFADAILALSSALSGDCAPSQVTVRSRSFLQCRVCVLVA